MKKNLLLALLCFINLTFANTSEKPVTGPSIGVILITSSGPVGSSAFFNIRIKNTGDEPLTNIYLTNSGGFMPVNVQGITIPNLNPGEEFYTNTFSNFIFSCPNQSFYSQIIVHATTPSSQEIIDMSSQYSFYSNDPTISNSYPDNIQLSRISSYQDNNNNSIADVGDAVLFTYNLSYNNFPGYIATYTITDNNAVISNPTHTSNGSTNQFQTTGIHYITQAEVNLGYVYNCANVSAFNPSCGSSGGYVSFTFPNPCVSCPVNPNCGAASGGMTTRISDLLPNNIVGSVKFNSNNDNCATGIGFPNRKVNATDGTSTYTTFTNNSGNYNIYIPNVGTYTTSAISNLGANFTSNPASVNVVSAGQNNNYNADFCISSATNYTDLSIVLYPLTNVRPGFNASYRMYYRNNGSTNLNGSVRLTYNNTKLSLVNASPVQNNIFTNNIIWNYSNLLPFEQRYIDITFNAFTPPTNNQGDNLVFTAVANPTAGDNYVADNTYVLNQTVVNAFDPNDKTVLEGATIQQSQVSNYLHYITRFQNTGSAAATTVVLKETLDPDLDWNTFEPVGASHTYNLQIKNGNQLTCTFSNIGLPDSTTNEPASHGWLAYKVKPKSTFTVGDIASSNSDIYFDYNPPIVTNNVTTQINNLSNGEFDKNNFKIYPNPANNYFVIENTTAEVSTYEILDIKGQQLSKGNVESLKPIDISKLQSGLYFITVKTENSSQTYKMIKQ